MKRILFASIFGCALAFPALSSGRVVNLVENPTFEEVDPGSHTPTGYDLTGAAIWRKVGREDEIAPHGIAFPGDAAGGGSVSQMVRHIDQSKGRWVTFRFRGLPEDGFAVTGDALEMKIEFYSKNGANYLDGATRTIYREVEKDRDALTVDGDYGKGGAAVWRSYELEELLPFPEVDTIKITVDYADGIASGDNESSFFITDFSLVQRHASLTGSVDPADAHKASPPADVDESKLVSLGGRWYYEPLPGESTAAPLTVTEENADRLFYKSDRYINPFLNNMTAWLRAGYKDAQGNIVTQDRFVPDNLVLIFKGDGFLTMKAKNLPNHPTAKFPDTYGTQGYNPSYIQELNKTYRLPLEPVLNPDAKAVDANDHNRALPMGAIGVAVNGVVFYNPFDAGMNDASNIMDRCCGHPSPDNRYHYHKYPVCVNTPFVDKGDAPSQVIGFAFDGFPIYGPYQSAGVMARDSTTNPLNAFNACYDDVRGWHYHVTPGKFPYIIGGYIGKTEPSDFERRPMRPPGGGPLPFLNGPPPGGGGPPLSPVSPNSNNKPPALLGGFSKFDSSENGFESIKQKPFPAGAGERNSPTLAGAVKRLKIAQRFSAGSSVIGDRVPLGTTEASPRPLGHSVVPAGFGPPGVGRFPALKRWAIFAENPATGQRTSTALRRFPAPNSRFERFIIPSLRQSRR